MNEGREGEKQGGREGEGGKEGGGRVTLFHVY